MHRISQEALGRKCKLILEGKLGEAKQWGWNVGSVGDSSSGRFGPSSQIFDSFQEFSGAPLDDGACGLLVVLDGRELGEGSFDAFEFGEGGGLVVEDAVHVADELVDAEVDDGEVVQEPLLAHHRLLQLQQPRVHLLRPLHLLEPPQLLGRLLLAVDRNHVAHVLDGPDVHLHHSLVPQRAPQQVGRAEPVDHVDAHGDRLGDHEAALAQVGQAGEGPVARALGVEALPLRQGKQLVLVVHPQILAQQPADLCLAAQVVVPDDDSLLGLALLALRGRGRQVLALLHFLVGNINYNQKSPTQKEAIAKLHPEATRLLNSSQKSHRQIEEKQNPRVSYPCKKCLLLAYFIEIRQNMKRELGLRLDNRRLDDLENDLRQAKQRDIYDYMVKIIIVGDTGVGKTNIISRFCAKKGEEGEFRDYHVATIGVDFSTRVVQLDNHRLKLQIWDTAGQERFKTITQTYYKGAAGIILVYAVNSEDSFLNIENWIEQVNLRAADTVRKILVANKIDVEDDFNEDSCMEQPRKVSKERGMQLASKFGMDYYEVSAKSNEGVSEMFKELAVDINTTIQKCVVKNEAEDMSMTISLNSKHTRNIRKIRKMGLQYKVEEEKSVLIKWKEKLCTC